jgi:hypothetical protein
MIRTYIKNLNPNKNLNIFIGGDGFAWVDRYTISNNPTPLNPVALKLALINNHSNVIYIARPCQYNFRQNCHSKYWTSDRFSKKILKNINQTINILKQKLNMKNKINLIGFSGGGALVVLLANRRDDITHITTIAGNLNHKLLHQIHHVTPLSHSLDAIDVALNITHI